MGTAVSVRNGATLTVNGFYNKPHMVSTCGHHPKMAKHRVAPDPNVGRNLNALMERTPELNSQTALHRATGIAQSTIGRIARGDSNATSGNLKKIADAFGVDLSIFYLNEEEFDRFLHTTEGPNAEMPAGVYSIRNIRHIPVVGMCEGGMPEVIWDGGDGPHGATDEYAEVATTDPHAFITEVHGTSMIPRYFPGEYALVEPNTAPELEDDVLVRLKDGRTMLKRLLGRRGGLRLGSYNDAEVFTLRPDDVSWMYYVAHPIPARRIKSRTDMPPIYSGNDRRRQFS